MFNPFQVLLIPAVIMLNPKLILNAPVWLVIEANPVIWTKEYSDLKLYPLQLVPFLWASWVGSEGRFLGLNLLWNNIVKTIYLMNTI